MQVSKRDGSLEDYSVEKIHKVVEWAIGDLSNVSLSEIEMNAHLSLRDKIGTEEIHHILIKSANDLVSPSHPNYQYVASRLLNMSLRKDLWENHDQPPKLSEHIYNNIDDGVYDRALKKKWTKEQLNKFNDIIDHDRDYLFTYAGYSRW